MKPKYHRTGLLALTVSIAVSAVSSATPLPPSHTHTIGNGFEADIGGWLGNGSPAAAPVRTASGTGGIIAADGVAYAKAVKDSFTRWGGYKSEFPEGGYTTSVDIYLDTNSSAANDTQFTYTSAINGVNGNHHRDFVFNVGFFNTGGNHFMVSASNGSSHLTSFPANAATINVAGWYTFEHSFQNVEGALEVTLTVKDSAGVPQGQWTLSEPAEDTIGETGVVGGNRYGWFPINEFPGGLAIDNSKISSNQVPSIRNTTDGKAHFTISSAVGEAVTDDVITLSAGDYSEGALTINKRISLKGPNATIHGNEAALRGAEARIVNTALTLGGGANINGLEIYQTNNTATAIFMKTGSRVRNSVLRRVGESDATTRAIVTENGVTATAIQRNLFTGDTTNGELKSWRTGVYSNGGQTLIENNTFDFCRTALNLDHFNLGITIQGNSFSHSQFYLSLGGGSTVAPTVTGAHAITGNDFDVATIGQSIINNYLVAADFRLNAIDNTFSGTATSALTLEQKLAIEAKMFHRGRTENSAAPANGVIDFVTGEQIVSTEGPGAAGIGSAIDAASPGDTVLVGPGTFTESVAVSKTLTFLGANAGTAASGERGAETVIDGGFRIAASGSVIDGFKITGIFGSSAKAGVAVAASGVEVRNNIFTGLTGSQYNGIETQYSLNGLSVTGNAFTGNFRGIYLNPGAGHSIVGNIFADNAGAAIATDGQSNLTVSDNKFQSNSGGFGASNVGVGVVFRGNDFSGGGIYHFGGEPIDANLNYWGAETGPTGAQIGGTHEALVDFNPWKGIGGNVITGTEGGTLPPVTNGDSDVAVVQNTTVTDTKTVGELTVGNGSTLTVSPGASLTAGDLNLNPGSSIIVNGGSLAFGGGSTVSGTFTIFNSFGSWNIDGDTTFNVSQSLALITDIHVAAGTTLTVNGGGELILDGCVINSKSVAPGADPETLSGTFNLNVEATGKLTMARSVVAGAVIDNAGPASRLFDNRFTASAISGTVGSVYHNVIPAGSSSTIDTLVDGWGNVADANGLENTFTLDLVAPNATTFPGRTLDADGNLFVRSGDPVVMKMDVAALGTKTIVAAEALLGYSSDMLAVVAADPVTPTVDWNNTLHEQAPAPTGAFGLVDSALGFDLNGPDDGTSTPGTIANVNFTAGNDGLTVGFFRVQTEDGAANDTRLTRSVSGSPSFLTPFTANTGELVIDSSKPVIDAGATAVQTQPSVATAVDVFSSSNRVFRNGATVTITFSAEDEGLAGLDAADATSDLVLTASNTTTTLDSSDYTVTAADNAGVVTYTVLLAVPTDATTGTYTVNASVRDRSGNFSTAGSNLLGSFVIANEAQVSVELDAEFVGESRQVTFVATGGSPKSWVKTLAFSSAVGHVVLEDVPAGTTGISAKAALTIRAKNAITLSPEGVATTAITGLKGGDLNNDNVINTLDYSILRYNWLTVAPAFNIDGDSANGVTIDDYNVFNANFYSVGSAE